MRYIHVAALLAIGVAASSCAPSQRPEDAAGEEDVGEAAQPLTQVDTMGGVGWSATAGVTGDPYTWHEIDSVSNKDVTVEMLGLWPQFQGSYTSAKANNCSASYVRMLLYKRANSSQPWTSFGDYSWHATPHFDQIFQPTQITSCMVDFELADAIHFVTSDQLLVIAASPTGDGGSGYELDTVRRESLSECAFAGSYINACLGGSGVSGGGSSTCADGNLCGARCINVASCAQIVDAYSGHPTSVSLPLLDCTTTCGE